MRTRTIRNRTIRTGAVLALLALGLPAQEEQHEPQRPRSEPVTVTLTFEGGTMAAFVAEVRKVQPTANIVMATRAADAIVPPMELRGAGIEQALVCACTVAEGPVEVRVKDFAGGGRPVYTVLAAPARVQKQVLGADPDEIEQRVFTLNKLTTARVGVEPVSVATILSAVEMVTSAAGQAPLLRYHQDSGILLVRGTREQVANASQTLAVLASDLDERETRARADRPVNGKQEKNDETGQPQEGPR